MRVKVGSRSLATAAIIAAMGAASAASAASESNACAVATAALRVAREQVVKSGLIVLDHEAPPGRSMIEKDVLGRVGVADDGYWPKAAPSKETAERFLAADVQPATSICPALTATAVMMGMQVGTKAEKQAERLNQHYRSEHDRSGSVIAVQAPVLTRRRMRRL